VVVLLDLLRNTSSSHESLVIGVLLLVDVDLLLNFAVPVEVGGCFGHLIIDVDRGSLAVLLLLDDRLLPSSLLH
jgi:hypothetical protein